MRAILALAASAVALVSLAGSQSPPATGFSRWTIVDPDGRAMTYLGRPSLFLSSGIALMPDVELADGTIEFDVAIHGQAGFAGVVFRGQSPDDYELIYLRTHRSRQWDALQYTPMFAAQEAWQLYAGPGYNGAAELPVNRWVPVRIEVAGYTARVFVDGSVVSQLTVTDLKRPWAPGRVGLWGRFGSAHFSNVKVTPAASSAPSGAPASPPEPGVITRWTLSAAFEASSLPADRVPDVERWDPVEAETSGIVNISRYRRPVRSAVNDGPDTVFARTVLQAERPHRARLAFGYSDAVAIYLNGRPVFSGSNRYLERDGSALGTMTLGPDVVYLDLAAGANELVFAVREAFGGWGLAAKLLDLK